MCYLIIYRPEDLEAAIKGGLANCDIVVTTGGVSMGEMDLLKPILEQKLGATIHFGRIMMKPGWVDCPFVTETFER